MKPAEKLGSAFGSFFQLFVVSVQHEQDTTRIYQYPAAGAFWKPLTSYYTKPAGGAGTEKSGKLVKFFFGDSGDEKAPSPSFARSQSAHKSPSRRTPVTFQAKASIKTTKNQHAKSKGTGSISFILVSLKKPARSKTRPKPLKTSSFHLPRSERSVGSDSGGGKKKCWRPFAQKMRKGKNKSNVFYKFDFSEQNKCLLPKKRWQNLDENPKFLERPTSWDALFSLGNSSSSRKSQKKT